MSNEIFPASLTVEKYDAPYLDRMAVIASISDILKEGDETFSRRTVEFLMGELFRAQKLLTQEQNREYIVELGRESTEALRTFLYAPNGSFSKKRLSVDAVVGGGVLIRTRRKETT